MTTNSNRRVKSPVFFYGFVLCVVSLPLLAVYVRHWLALQPTGFTSTGGIARMILDEAGVHSSKPIWEPSNRELKHMESLLGDFLGVKQNQHPDLIYNLKDYNKRYVGFIEGGRKSILIIGIEPSFWRESCGLPDYWCKFSHGGQFRFRLVYSVPNQQFSGFGFYADGT